MSDSNEVDSESPVLVLIFKRPCNWERNHRHADVVIVTGDIVAVSGCKLGDIEGSKLDGKLNYNWGVFHRTRGAVSKK